MLLLLFDTVKFAPANYLTVCEVGSIFVPYLSFHVIVNQHFLEAPYNLNDIKGTDELVSE